MAQTAWVDGMVGTDIAAALGIPDISVRRVDDLLIATGVTDEQLAAAIASVAV